ncbi:MAG: efflux RND transporter periplasmic adaptor subunit [Caulobacteraceae bacterium]|nr:efflux RND transporter periplasmic adaptor subunit [Caulobacter sp.]
MPAPSRALVACAAALALAPLAACHKPHAAAAAAPAGAPGEQPLTVSVAPVQVRALSGGVEASGLLVPQYEAAVTTELNGYRVRQVLVDQGAHVAAGQPLAVLDDTLLRSMIAQQRAVVAQQKVAAERSQAEADRVKNLDNAGVLPEEQIAERRLAAKTGVAAVAAAQAQLDDLNTREALMTVRAPVAGLVLARTVRPGDVASPSMVMFRIASGDVVELNAEVPEDELGRIRVGDAARVTLPGGAQLTGRVRVISPEVDQQTKLGHVRITLPQDPALRPGGFARASFVDSRRDAPVVPEEAIHFDADGASVMVLGPDDRVHRTPIVTGVRAGGWVELVKGPPAGANVLLSGGSFVLDGDKVRPNFVGKGVA